MRKTVKALDGKTYMVLEDALSVEEVYSRVGSKVWVEYNQDEWYIGINTTCGIETVMADEWYTATLVDEQEYALGDVRHCIELNQITVYPVVELSDVKCNCIHECENPEYNMGHICCHYCPHSQYCKNGCDNVPYDDICSPLDYCDDSLVLKEEC